MTLSDSNLTELLNRLTPRDRRIVEDAFASGKMTDDVRAILRWIKRRLKRRVRSKRK